jgi:adenine phosphoribosyltransferase
MVEHRYDRQYMTTQYETEGEGERETSRVFTSPKYTSDMERLAQSLRDAPIIRKGEYEYFVHPISDGVPMLEPSLLREIVIGIIRKADLDGVDKIVTPAAMGIHISTAVSLMTDIPVVVIRKRQYGLDGEVSLAQVTGYSENEMYLNDVDSDDRVLLLDDVLSTGGTLNGITTALEEIGADIADIVAVIKKVGGENAMDDYGVKTLINVDVVSGEVVIVDEDGDG